MKRSTNKKGLYEEIGGNSAAAASGAELNKR